MSAAPLVAAGSSDAPSSRHERESRASMKSHRATSISREEAAGHSTDEPPPPYFSPGSTPPRRGSVAAGLEGSPRTTMKRVSGGPGMSEAASSWASASDANNASASAPSGGPRTLQQRRSFRAVQLALGKPDPNLGEASGSAGGGSKGKSLRGESFEGIEPVVLLASPARDAHEAALASEAERQRQRRLESVRVADPSLRGTKSSVKAAMVFGEPNLAPLGGVLTAEQVLGHDGAGDARAMRLANEALVKEREAASLERAEQARTALREALSSSTSRDFPEEQIGKEVPLKALDRLGDEELERQAKLQGGKHIAALRGRLSPKAVGLLGSSRMAAPKARTRLGSSDTDGYARAAADRALMMEREASGRASLAAALALRASEEQLAPPEVVLRGTARPGRPFSDKAARTLGDPRVVDAILHARPRVVSPKAMHVLGEPLLAGRKALHMVGNPAGDARARKVAHDTHVAQLARGGLSTRTLITESSVSSYEAA